MSVLLLQLDGWCGSSAMLPESLSCTSLVGGTMCVDFDQGCRLDLYNVVPHVFDQLELNEETVHAQSFV